MIKECPVLMMNDAVTVVRFENTNVQLPSIHKNCKVVRVANENGRYFVVDEKHDMEENSKPKKNKGTKKATVQKDVNDIDEAH